MSTAAGMAAIMAGWVLTAAAFCGLGSFFFRRPAEARISWADSFWAGLALVNLLLETVNLAWPINRAVSMIFFLVGLFSLALQAKRFNRPRLSWSQGVGALLLGAIIVWLTDLALESPGWYDSGLYYFSAIRWANEHVLPLGLGNLHGRLAFNQSVFLLAAFLNRVFWDGLGPNLTNGLLLFALLFTGAVKFRDRGLSDPRRWLALAVCPIALFAVATIRGYPVHLTDPSPDMAVVQTELAVALYAIGALSEEGSPEERERHWTTLVMLVGYLVTLKLSAWIFAAAVLVLIARRWRTERTPCRVPGVIGAVAVAGASFLCWLARDVVTSGYTIYPLVWTGLPVSWKVPVHLAATEESWIRSWARQPGGSPAEVLGHWHWLKPWWRANLERADFVWPLAALGCATAMAWAFGRSSRRPASKGCPWSGLALACTASLVFWFLSAPDTRFLGAALFLLPTALFGWSLAASLPNWRGPVGGALLAVFWIGAIAAIGRAGFPWVIVPQGRIAQPIPRASLKTEVTASGAKVFVPVEGNLCWDAPLPCTPYFRPQLCQRGPHLGEGFYLDESKGPAPDF